MKYFTYEERAVSQAERKREKELRFNGFFILLFFILGQTSKATFPTCGG